MSEFVMREVWEHYPGSGSDLTLLLALADEASKDGAVFVEDARMIRKSRLTPHAYAVAFAAIERRGWIRKRAKCKPDFYEIPFLR
jgi:hypothetical protein